MNGTLPVWVTILVALIGSCGAPAVTWLIGRLDKRDQTLTRQDLDDALGDSPILQDIKAKLDADYARINALELNQLRMELFAHTRSRTQHERQLEAGREYLDHGGNGLGHARFSWLEDDYETRLKTDDWDYTKSHHKD